jgi:hypothetical protein
VTQPHRHARHDGGSVRVPWPPCIRNHACSKRTAMRAQDTSGMRAPRLQRPGCWTTFLTCPNVVDAPDVSAAQLMG